MEGTGTLLWSVSGNPQFGIEHIGLYQIVVDDKELLKLINFIGISCESYGCACLYHTCKQIFS